MRLRRRVFVVAHVVRATTVRSHRGRILASTAVEIVVGALSICTHVKSAITAQSDRGRIRCVFWQRRSTGLAHPSTQAFC